MKTLRPYLLMLAYFFSVPAKAQTVIDVQRALSAANSIKTGNYQDVLTNLMLLDIKNITGPTKALEYKSSLLELKLLTNPSLNVDTNYIKQTFSRNLQLGIRVNMVQDFSFKGFGGGITYALINKRDSSVLSLIGTPVDIAFKRASASFADAKMEFRSRLLEPDGTIFRENKKKLDRINDMYEEGKIDLSLFPADIRDRIEIDAQHFVDSAMRAELERTRRKPLLVIAVNGNYNTITKAVDNSSFNIAYLQGITKSGRPLELDVRANARYYDTIVKTPKPRTLVDFSLGANYALLYSKRTGITFIEVKPNIEYAAILNSAFTGEETAQFLANAEFRLRVTKDIWFPVGVKYDIQNQNLLGFLNISCSIDALKGTH